jgi:hypothetical protein
MIITKHKRCFDDVIDNNNDDIFVFSINDSIRGLNHSKDDVECECVNRTTGRWWLIDDTFGSSKIKLVLIYEWERIEY